MKLAISIAKAGVTTILNSRTAVLATSLVFGRYDDFKSIQENIDYQLQFYLDLT